MNGMEEGSSAESEPNQNNPYLKRQGLFCYNDWDSKSPNLDDVALTSESNTKNKNERRGCSGNNNCDFMPSEQVYNDGTLYKGGYESSMFNIDPN